MRNNIFMGPRAEAVSWYTPSTPGTAQPYAPYQEAAVLVAGTIAYKGYLPHV